MLKNTKKYSGFVNKKKRKEKNQNKHSYIKKGGFYKKRGPRSENNVALNDDSRNAK